VPSVKGLTISRNSDAVPVVGPLGIIPTGSAASRMLAKDSSNSGLWRDNLKIYMGQGRPISFISAGQSNFRYPSPA